MDDIRKETLQRYDKMEQKVEDTTVEKEERFTKLEATVDQLKDNNSKRFERLGARVELAMNELKEAASDLNKKLGTEAAAWRARCDKTDKQVRDNKQVTDVITGSNKQHYDTLRGDV